VAFRSREKIIIVKIVIDIIIKINQKLKRDLNDYFCSARKPDFARVLNHALQSFEECLFQNKSNIPLEQSTAKRLQLGQRIVRTGGQNIGIVIVPQELRHGGITTFSRTLAIDIGDDHWCHLSFKACKAQICPDRGRGPFFRESRSWGRGRRCICLRFWSGCHVENICNYWPAKSTPVHLQGLMPIRRMLQSHVSLLE